MPAERSASARRNTDPSEPTKTRKSKRVSNVSIIEPESDSDAESGEPSELQQKATPRGRKAARDSGETKIPHPNDDVFKSSYWPSLPAGMVSFESQITNVKLDLIMAYVQDVRSEISTLKSGRARAKSTGSQGTAASEDRSAAPGSTSQDNPPPEYAKFRIPDDEVEEFESKANAAKDLGEIEDVALRLYIKQNPQSCKYTKNLRECKAEGVKYRDYMLEIGQTLGETTQQNLRRWSDKACGDHFLVSLKNRRKEYEEEIKAKLAELDDDGNEGDAEAQEEAEAGGDGETASGRKADTGATGGTDDDGAESSEPIRGSTGTKSQPKSSGGNVTKFSAARRGGSGGRR